MMKASLILHNGKILTPQAEVSSVAIAHGTVLAVGDQDSILALGDANTLKIDLHGNSVIPGLCDAHFHLYDWALGLQRLQLQEVHSAADLYQKVQTAVTAAEPDEWILGQGWNESRWPVPVLPNRTALDEISPSNPVILWRSDLHLALANAVALQRANIHAGREDPPHGVIDRDAQGNPTGILRELAVDLVRAVIPPVSNEQVDAALRDAIPRLHRLGLTGLHDFRLMDGSDGPPAFAAYQRLNQAQDLPLRLWMQIAGSALEHAIALGLRSGFGDERLRLGHLKLFADGGQGARTAWMLEPYLDTGGIGMPLMAPELLEEKISRANQAGIAVAVHAIGDRAIETLLAMFERMPSDKDTPARANIPHRIEHVQNIRPEQITRMADLGLAASVQPVHLTDDMEMFAATVGARSQYGYPFRSMVQAGIQLAFGSDAPVASPNPFLGMQAAATRQRPDSTPKEGWHPEQRVPLRACLHAYSSGSATLSGRSQALGQISPGYKADLVVIRGDFMQTPLPDLHSTQVLMTIFDGEIVYTG